MNSESFFDSKEDFDRAEEEARARKIWGSWTLDESAPLSLDIRPYPNGGPYEVPLFKLDCDFPTFVAWLGHWVQHLQDKSWMSASALWDFVDAAQTIYRVRKP